MAENPVPSEADYIICGGGLAGCTLASRLRQCNPSLSVLLIEAGGDSTGHPLTTSPLACFAAARSDIDWAYPTTPQKHLDDRIAYSPGGKVLSGGSAINYGTWTRGSSIDYDHWAEVVGDERWSYNGQLPYFKKTEHHHDVDADPQEHGFGGPIHTASISGSGRGDKYPLRNDLKTAWEKVGVKYIQDGNAGAPLGLAEMVENWRDGKRQNARDAYDLSGVQILTNTMVKKVLIDNKNGEKTATGVQLVNGTTITAKKEVIISAGALRTPQILMLSGIGPKTELSRHGIPTIIDNREVGQNFYDHMALCQWWKVRHPERAVALGNPEWFKDPIYQRGKPIDWIVFSHIPEDQMRAAIEADSVGADTEQQQYLLHPRKCHTETLVIYVPASASASGQFIPIDGTHISSAVLGLMPISRGSVTLASADPSDAPVIDPDFYAHEVDRVAIRHGAREVMRVLQDTEEGNAMVECETPPEGMRPLTFRSTDAEIDERVRRVGDSFYHAAGSAAMGKVVDSELRVFGVRGLRVVDASVLPVSVSAHYQVAVYAVAEQAADMILMG